MPTQLPAPSEVTPARQLAAVPPAQFVAERDRLAAALARAGDKAGAAELKKMRKPTRAVWVLNQLAREDAPSCEELFTASDELASVQQSAGGDVATFRAALARQRTLFETLQDLARRLLEEARETADDGTLTRVTRGLRAAAAGGDVRRDLLAGALVEEPEEPGFLSFGAGDAGGAPEPKPKGAHEAASASVAPARHETAAPVKGPSRDEARREKLRAARDEAERLARSSAREREAALAVKEEAEAHELHAREARDAAVAELARLREAVSEAEDQAQELGAVWGRKKRTAVEATAAWEAARARAAHLDVALADADKALP